jgi:hypothetical protein
VARLKFEALNFRAVEKIFDEVWFVGNDGPLSTVPGNNLRAFAVGIFENFAQTCLRLLKLP